LDGFGLALLIPRRRFGPDGTATTKAREVVSALIEALVHLRSQRAAGIGLLTIAAHQLVYGIVTVATILVFRNYFHSVDQVDAAITDLGLLVIITGAGFVFTSVVTPQLSARLGPRSTMIICLLASTVFQLVPGAIYSSVPLGLRALRHDLQCHACGGCGDRRGDPACQRQIGDHSGRDGRLLPADRAGLRARQPWREHERGHRVSRLFPSSRELMSG
jgi:hypothetical protein